jgi:hypothetical protein
MKKNFLSFPDKGAYCEFDTALELAVFLYGHRISFREWLEVEWPIFQSMIVWDKPMGAQERLTFILEVRDLLKYYDAELVS